MLSKIRDRSGLSGLLWIKDAVSHRAIGGVLELVWAAFYLLARRLRSVPASHRVARFRLRFTNFSKVSRFLLLVNRAASILLRSFADPLGQRSPLGTISKVWNHRCAIAIDLSPRAFPPCIR